MKEYAKLLAKSNQASMVLCSLEDEESPEYYATANEITTITFAVAKNDDKERLISRPKQQNTALPETHHTCLPSPDNFQMLQFGQEKLAAFSFDIENVFHNVLHPPDFARIFSFQIVRYGNLSGTLQCSITTQLKMRPGQS